jgi:cytochrome P450 family 110
VPDPISAGPPLRIVNTLRLVRDPFSFYAACRRKYGETFWLRAFNGDVLVSTEDELVRDLLRADAHQVRPFDVSAFDGVLGTHSLLTLWGDAHRQERKLLTPPFHGERMRAYGEVMLASVEEGCRGWGEGTPIVAADALLGVSIRVIVRAVFGVAEPERVAQWDRAIRQFVSRIVPAAVFFPVLQVAPLGLGPWGRFERAREALDQLLLAEIAARRAHRTDGADILGMMLDGTHADGRPLSDADIRDELVTLLLAGHETTQIAMAWMLYHVSRDERVRERLVAELDATDGSPEALAKAPYLDAVVRETLRIDPIVPDLIRTLATDLTLGNHALPAGTHVGLVAAMVHTRPDLYPEPGRFRPERFEERTFRPHEYMPFGGGVRRCIGAALATWEVKVVVGTLLRRFAFDRAADDRAVRRNVTMGPRRGVRLVVRERRARRAAA